MTKIKQVFILFLFFCFFGSCANKASIPADLTATVPPTPLTAAQVTTIVEATASSLGNTTIAIAVVDRLGNPLALFGRADTTADNQELALSLARTGAFFSNDEAPLSSRTVAYISREHFPPGIDNTPSGALFDIEHTNRGCDLNIIYTAGSEIPPATNLAGGSPGYGVSVIPGGVPLFQDGRLVGGLGVAGVDPEAAEFAGATGESLFPPTPANPGIIFIDGISLPFLNQTSRPANFDTGDTSGFYSAGPTDGAVDPSGDLMTVIDSPTATDPKLTADDVNTIIDNAIAQANNTRAAIRLPLGQRAKMVIAVGDTQGNILGLYRMRDSTIFSIDVAVTKARNVAYFSSTSIDPEDQFPGVPAGTAITNRTLGFSAQPFFPSGINGTSPGPMHDVYNYNIANPCTQGHQPASANQSGIVFFPGSSPLYKEDASGNKILVGGLGVSGDGVEQDDYVTAAGITGYEPDDDIRADQFEVDSIRLPYFKFPRNPEN